MLFSNFEYVPLRLMRRFLFKDGLLQLIGNYLPYYKINLNECTPQFIVDNYERFLQLKGFTCKGTSVLEVGSGRTNSTGYLLAGRGASRVFCYEPYADFDAAQDRRLLDQIVGHVGVNTDELAGRVTRISSLPLAGGERVDLIVSSSVLEHVRNLQETFYKLRMALRQDGAMLHLVDYRDHFFKYPFHFLQFSQTVWNQLLDPGDLPRWRLADHLRAFRELGFAVEVLEKRRDPSGFNKVSPYLAPEFDRTDPDIDVTYAAIFAKID